jgi:hypothetical protein
MPNDNIHGSLDATITELMIDMKTRDGDSEEYATMLNRLERLNKLRKPSFREKISPDTLILVGSNLLGILIIVSYEHGHVLASRALNTIIKPH